MPDKGRNILALDIAFGPAAACLLRRDGNRFTANGRIDRPHSQSIMPLLQSLLDEAGMDWPNLDMLGAGNGPGSFTGLRIAAATLAGINASLGLPIIELSSLAISALQADSDAPLYVIEDARASLAYMGRYRGAEPLDADRCLRWEEIDRMQPANYTAHQPDGRLKDWQYLPPALPRAQAMARLLAERCSTLEDTAQLPRLVQPAYLISSQAERHAPSI